MECIEDCHPGARGFLAPTRATLFAPEPATERDTSPPERPLGNDQVDYPDLRTDGSFDPAYLGEHHSRDSDVTTAMNPPPDF
jgi:hypothetical protein